MKPVIVDVHCHNFNADDLPLKGFIQEVLLESSSELGVLLPALVDYVLQKRAPGYEEEMARLRHLLTGTGSDLFDSQPYSGGSSSVDGTFEINNQSGLVTLEAWDPVFVRRLGAALDQETWPAHGDEATAPAEMSSLVGIAQLVQRAYAWAKMFGRSRLDLTAALINTFTDSVDLFCPLLVDLGPGLGDRPKTTMRQQMEMAEGISMLSMQGRIPRGGKAKIHPFIGFDPRQQVRAIQGGYGDTPLDTVRVAVLRRGFVGVKLYPSMGWRPIGNRPSPYMTAPEAKLVDSELRKFYKWCEEEQVPIASHANQSNYASSSFKDFGGPEGWQEVLEEFPDLHLNLGHFGGAKVDDGEHMWPTEFARLAARYRYVFVDVGNHRIYDRHVRNAYVLQLQRMLSDSSTTGVFDRIMYGSDWYMLALYPEANHFLNNYRQIFETHFGRDNADKFVGRNALRFLGFDDGTNANTIRLNNYYQIHGTGSTPFWLASPAGAAFG